MRLQRIMFLGVFTVLVWLVADGCKHRTVDDPVGITYISGIVRDSSSGVGIESAMIIVNDTLANDVVYTDSIGHYVTHGWSWGDQYRLTFKVICQAAGYVTKIDSVYSTPEHRKFDSVNFMLTHE